MATTVAEVMVSTLKAAGVRREMKAAGIPTYGIDLVDPDFVGIARSAGLFGVRVNWTTRCAAFTHDGPALVDVRTARQELSLPPKLTYGQIKGFTLYATRTILSGEGRSSSSSPRPTYGRWTSSDRSAGRHGAACAGTDPRTGTPP
jgi:hypothetical protein